ncbi:MAG: hypothetical protein ACLFN0_05305 [Thermovirgaceae bacterium]
MTRVQRGVVLLLVLAFLAVPLATAAASGCERCPRRAFLKEVKNLHSPSHEQDMEEWNTCMAGQMTYETFDPGDEQFRKALAECGPGPGETPVMYPGPIMSYLSQLLRTGCFAMTWPGARVCELSPEYFFTAEFNASPSGNGGSGKPVRSRLTIRLFYDGDRVEEVDSWTTESTARSVDSQYRRMFTNADAAMKRSVPLEETLWDFERQPLSCSVTAEKGRIWPGETVKIILDDFRDEKGRQAKDFQRIVVSVREGRILNGDDSQYGFQSRVFRVDGGRIELEYEAPYVWRDEQGRELVTVYNSCDIGKTSVKPLFETARDKKIAEQKLEIRMPEGDHMVINTAFTEKRSSEEVCKAYWEVHRFEKQLEFSVVSPLEFKKTQKGVNKDEICVYYTITQPRLENFLGSLTETLDGEGYDGKSWTMRVTGRASKPFGEFHQGELKIVMEKDTGRIKRVEVPDYSVPMVLKISYYLKKVDANGAVETETRTYMDSQDLGVGCIIEFQPPRPPGVLHGEEVLFEDPKNGVIRKSTWRVVLSSQP